MTFETPDPSPGTLTVITKTKTWWKKEETIVQGDKEAVLKYLMSEPEVVVDVVKTVRIGERDIEIE